MQIEVDFQTWKTLTGLLQDENDTHDQVIRRLLGGVVHASRAGEEQEVSADARQSLKEGAGAYFKDVFLPDGTELRATHKGKTYFAKISGSEWIDDLTNERRSSPSQAAYFITNNHVNGWLFWLVKRPGDNMWHSLNALRAGQV